MELPGENKQIYRRADYDKLYATAHGYIDRIRDLAESAQEKLEEMYLEQTELIDAPEHLKIVDTDVQPDNPT